MPKKTSPEPESESSVDLQDILSRGRAGRIKLSKIVPFHMNARAHDAEQIALLVKSIKGHGFIAPFLLQEGTNMCVAGHGRLAALKIIAGKDDPEVPAIWARMTDEEAAAYSLVDNRLTDLSTWKLPELKSILAELDTGAFDMDLTGFDADALAELFPQDASGLKDGADPDAVPDPPAQPWIQLGDLVLLGQHRLLVADCTDPANLALLMDGEEADMVLTDPPYNVDYEAPQWVAKSQGKAGKNPKKIKNDNQTPEEFGQFLVKAFLGMSAATKKDAAFYVFYPIRLHATFESCLASAGLTIKTQIIWTKNQAGYGFQHYRWMHEPVALAAKDGAVPLIYVPAHETVIYAARNGEKEFWRGDKAQTTVWNCGRELANRCHPTQKPVELLRKPITNSSRSGMLVLDPFGGSGSTLITCESMGRRCNSLELDPKFAQCILERWQDATGRTARVMRGGKEVTC